MSNGNVVDSKIVELELNNQKFESNANTSISTLGKLKNALNFSGSTKNFEDMNRSLHKIDVSSLSAGVHTLRDSLNSLKNVVVFSWIADEAIKAKNAVESFIKGVTIDQVSAGFNKYAEKTSAVQTIMAATAKDFTDQGEQMEYVNGQLEKLNWFTDETSYNFLDMVNNIGKFTSNNVKLDEAVTSMQGISNWAAISGANVNEAGRAMYNLSQAIAVGSVKLMDWKSIENANMATAEFKQTAIDTAVELGTLTKESDGLYKTLQGHAVSVSNFNQALSDGWFTSEALLKTLDNYGAFTNQLYESLEKMSDSMTTSQLLQYIEDYKNGSIDMNEAVKETGLTASDLKIELEKLGSEEMEFGLKAFKAAQEAKTFQEAVDSVKDAVSTGWMNTFEIMFGDYLQAKNLWTDLANDLYDIFAEGGNTRNELLKAAFGHQTAINDNDWAILSKAGLASPEYIAAVRRNARMHGVYVDMMADDETWLNDVVSRGLVTMTDLNDAFKSVYGNSDVDQEMLAMIKNAKETDSTFQELYETISKYSSEDLARVAFGDGTYAEGLEELEQALDSTLDHFELSQESGAALIAVLQEMENGGHKVADTLMNMSDAELMNLDLTEQDIQELRKLQAEGRLTDQTIMDLLNRRHMTGGELWVGSLRNGMEALKNLIDAVKESFHDIFPETTEDTIFNFLQGLYDYTSNLKETIANSENLRSVLHGIFSVVDLLLRALNGLGQIARNALVTILDALGINLADIAGNVGDAITKFREWVIQNELIEKAVTRVSDAISKAVTWVKSLVKSFLQIPFISRNITRFKGAFSMAFNTMPAFLERLSGKFEEFKKHVEELGGFKLGNLPAIFTAFKEDILDYISNWSGLKGIKNAFKNFGAEIGGILTGVKEKIVSALSDWRASLDDSSLVAKIYDFIVGAINKVKAQLEQLSGGDKSVFSKVFDFIIAGITNIGKFISGINWGTIGRIGFALLPIIAIIKVLKKITGLFKSFGNILGNVETITDGLAGKLKPSKLTEITNLFKSIAILIGVVTACIYVFTTIPPDKLENALWTLLGIVTFLTVFVGAMAAIDGFTGGISKGTTSALVGAAVAIYIVTAALIKLSKIENINDAIVSMAIIGALLIAMYAVMAYMNMIGGKAKRGQASTLLSMAAAIYVMTMALERLAKIPADQLNGALVSMAIIGALLIAMYAVMSYMNMIGGKSKRGQASSLIATAAAIYLMVMALERIAKIPTERLNQALIVISVLGLVLAGVQVALGLIRKFGGSTSAAQVAGMIASAAALYIMVAALAKIADIPADRLEDTVVVIGVLGIILAGLQAVLGAINSFGGDVSIGQIGGLIGTAAALYIMAEDLAKIAEIPEDRLEDATVVISILTGLLGAMEAVLGLIYGLGGDVSAGQIIAMIASAAALYIMAETVGKLAEIPSNRLENATVAISILTGLLGAIEAVMGIIYGMGGDVSAGQIISMVASAAALYILSAAMVKLSEIDSDKFADVEGAMLLLGAILSAIILVGGMAGSVSPSLLILAALIGVVGIVFYAIASLPVEGVMAAAIAIIGIFASLSLLMLAITAVGMAGPAVDIGILALLKVLAVLGVVTLIAGVIGGLVGLLPEGVMKKVITGLDRLILVGQKIGEFLASFVTGFATGVASALPEIGQSIAGFMEAMQGVQPMDTAGVESFKQILLAVVGIDLVGFVGDLLGSDDAAKEGLSYVQQFAVDIAALSEGLSTWAENMNGLGEIEVPEDALKDLATAIGKINWTEFKGALMEWIANGLTGDDQSAVQKFSEDLTTLASSLQVWQEKMNEIGAITVPSAEISALAEALGEVPGTGLFDYIKNFFNGAPDFDEFKTNVTKLGEAIASFDTAIGDDVDTDKISQMSDAVSSLADIGNKLSGQQLSDSWFGKGILKQFASAIIDFANELAGFADITIDLESLSSFASSTSTLATATETLSGIDIDGDIVDLTVLGQFKAGIKVLSESISGLSSLDTSGVDKLTGAVDKLAAADISSAVDKLSSASSLGSNTDLSSSGKEMGSSLASGISAQSGAMSSAMGDLVKSARSAITTDGFGSQGSDIAKALADGISRSASLAADAMRQVINSARNQAGGHIGSFYSAGSQMGAGFANGIAGSAFRAMIAARAMAVAALEAARAALRVRSPSKEAYEIGNFFGLGFTNAIDDNVGSAYDSGYGMADAARKGLHNAARAVKDILSSDFDSSPVIRPVLDLSEIQNGASSIGNLLNSSPIPVTGNLSAIRGNVNARSMVTNGDVVSAISKLRNSLNNKPAGNTYVLDGITYDDGSNVAMAIKDLVHATQVERRANG